jgi:hypothetical protein
MMSPNALWLSGRSSSVLASASVGVGYEAGAVWTLMLMFMSPGAVRCASVDVGVRVGYGASAAFLVMCPAGVRSLSMSAAVVAEGLAMMIVVIGISGESSGDREEAQKESCDDVLFLC